MLSVAGNSRKVTVTPLCHPVLLSPNPAGNILAAAVENLGRAQNSSRNHRWNGNRSIRAFLRLCTKVCKILGEALGKTKLPSDFPLGTTKLPGIFPLLVQNAWNGRDLRC